MKKRNKTAIQDQIPQHNPVAKFAHSFNKSLVFADKTQYRRNAKHKKQEVSLILFSNSSISQAA
ncbi:MAG: hypothetical protein WAX77_08700 [Methylococcaceae bacterium]